VSLYLSRADVARRTCRKQKKRQIDQLARMGIQFELDGEGWPLVKTNAPSTTNHAEQMMIEALRRAS
jgi:hypothetical protein